MFDIEYDVFCKDYAEKALKEYPEGSAIHCFYVITDKHGARLGYHRASTFSCDGDKALTDLLRVQKAAPAGHVVETAPNGAA